MTPAEEKIHAKIARIKDKDIRTIMGICHASKKYPLDCIVDGGLDLLVDYILGLEGG
jgi:hypothetical protein